MDQEKFDQLLETSSKIGALEAALGVIARHLQETQGFDYREALQQEAAAILKAFSGIKQPPKIAGQTVTSNSGVAKWLRLMAVNLDSMPDTLDEILRAHEPKLTPSNPGSSE